ncbi:MAG: NUDIX hydrolase [archaeon]|nr:NUDIX hydrolase [archaeon]
MNLITRYLLKLKGPGAAVAGIIIKDSKILLTKRSKMITEKEKWCLPGGKINLGENSIEAIKREIKEEIGANVKNLKFLFYHDEIIKKDNLHTIVLIFKIEIKGDIKPNWEVSDIEWFDKNKLDKLNFAFTHKDIINKFLKLPQ